MKTKVLACALICLYLSACATIFKGTSEDVAFSSSPDKAEVWVNGTKRGETPLAIKLKCNETYVIEFRKEGHTSRAYTITNKVGAGWVILDVLAGLVGVVVDAATGAWYSLDIKNINAILEKQQ